MPAPTSPLLLRTLLSRLRGPESLEVEFKRGGGGLPKDLWPTVSAFANTYGGWILVGVREHADGRFEIEGLKNPEARLQDFYNQIRNRQKISVPVCGADDARIEPVEGRPLLVIRVPAASRKERPVYTGSNPYEGTYLRRNSGDYRCTKSEVDRMMRDASDTAADSAILDGYGLDDLDREALARYRRRYQTEQPGSPWNGYEDLRFLQALGAHRRERQTDREGLTAAGLLLFGTDEALREWRSRHLLDYRRLPDDGSTQERWTDRITWEGHLFGAFETIYPRLVADLPVPFQLQHGVRRGEGPAQVAMREALINLLVHADYAETDASLVFRHEQGCRFQNPGSSRVPKRVLLSGDRSDPRNPLLVAAFRHIGLADEAGTGIPKILQAWHQLGFKAPDIDVGTERYEFALRLRYIHFLSTEDRTWLTALGDLSDEPKQLALVHAKEQGSVDNAQLCKLTGQHPADATKTLTGLRDGGLLDSEGAGRGTYYTLSLHAQTVLDAVREAPAQPNLFDVELASSHKDSESARTTHADSEGSAASMEGSTVDIEGSASDIEGSEAVSMPDQFVGTVSQWHTLAALAIPVRQSLRAKAGEVGDLVVALCASAALSLSELALLVGRKRSWVREIVREKMASGEIGYLYPEKPRSSKQRYIAPPHETP